MASHRRTVVHGVASRNFDVTDEDTNGSKSMTGDIDLMASFGSDNEQAGTESNSSGRKRKHDHQQRGERIVFSDNEDPEAEYDAFANRKSENRKKAAARTRKAKAEATKSSIVGRKPKTAIKLRDHNVRKNEFRHSDSDSDDDESYAPQFIKKWRGDLAEQRRFFGESGYHLPLTTKASTFRTMNEWSPSMRSPSCLISNLLRRTKTETFGR